MLWQQVKVTERYIRRLEFHLSKVPAPPSHSWVRVRVRGLKRMNGCLLLQVEELYEAYCLQRRLRDGANKMVKAYTTSPGSKEARESLAEANRGYKEYTEVGEQRGSYRYGT